jgi:hypothetical protein
MGHPAIPTMYKGVQFRSRLEARWAAFFDLAKTPWLYEPIDLEGYIPDFVIKWAGVDLLVEVKPAMVAGELQPAADKVERTSWAGPAWVVGARLGLLMERTLEQRYHEELWSRFSTMLTRQGLKGFLKHVPWRWETTVTDPPAEMCAAWNEAGNRVQYRSPRPSAKV